MRLLNSWPAECLSLAAHVVSDGLVCLKAVTHSAAQHERHGVGSLRRFRRMRNILGPAAVWNLYAGMDVSDVVLP